jgi:hypothetical protein
MLQKVRATSIQGALYFVRCCTVMADVQQQQATMQASSATYADAPTGTANVSTQQ